MTRMSSTLPAAALTSILLTVAGPAHGQAPSPAEAARASEVPPTTRLELDAGDVSRLDTARRMRRSGFVLMGLSLATVGTMALVGLADHSCDHSTEWSCVDGPALFASMGAAMVAPVFLTGAGFTTAGYVIERRERRRQATLSVGATGLRLAF